MGTLVRDALDPQLHDGTAITSATTTTGDGQYVGFPGHVQVEAVYGTITGSSVTVDINVQGSWQSDFSSDVVDYGWFDTVDENDDGETKALDVYADVPYLRAVIVTAGTVTSVPVTITVRERHLDRVTPGPGAPGAPGTGTGYPDAAND